VANLTLSPRLIFMLAVSLLFWGSTYPSVRLLVQEFAPVEAALLRFLVASLAMGLIAWMVKIRLPTWQDLWIITPTTLLGNSIYQLLLSSGLQGVPSGAGSVLVTLSPIITAMLAQRFLGERLGMGGWIGITISATGAILISLGANANFQFEPRSLLLLGAALVSSISTILSKNLLNRYNFWEITAYTTWLGTLFLLPTGTGLFVHLPQAPLPIHLAALYLGIFPTVLAGLTWYYVLAHVPASRLSVWLYLVPPLSFGVGWLVLGEVPTLLSVLGGLLALVGVGVVTTSGRRG
jgi:drug/metabolite transporter (DMT)-like permease